MEPTTRYCPTCNAPRTPDQQQGGFCVVCGTDLRDEAQPTPRREPWRPAAEPGGATPERQPPSKPHPDQQAAEPGTAEPVRPASPPPRPIRSDPAATTAAPDDTRPDAEPPRPAIPPPPPGPATVQAPASASPERPARPTPTAEPVEDDGYRQVVARIEEHLGQGYEPFGLVGLAGSGKTHFLKALTPLLARHSIAGQKATLAFQSAEIPGPTAYRVFDYAYEGPGGKFVMLDAGGELFRLMQRNDWEASMADRGVLGRWLHRCRGLFCFLHLDAYHFGKLPPEVEPGRDPAETRRGHEQRMLQARQELEFFKYFLLFLRALRAEQGDFDRLVARCRDPQHDSLDAALRTYQGAPLLDLPVMFFFTQADAYQRRDVEVRPGLYLDPRRLQVPPHVFAARYLPTLFGGVASQVRCFKFDFLQSYEDHPTGRRDERGEPIVETYLEAPEDPTRLLSAGLLSGLEFVLRNPPQGGTGGRRGTGGRWRRLPVPRLDTRRALLLDRLLHPKRWEGVPRNLLGGWRSPGPAKAAP